MQHGASCHRRVGKRVPSAAPSGAASPLAHHPATPSAAALLRTSAPSASSPLTPKPGRKAGCRARVFPAEAEGEPAPQHPAAAQSAGDDNTVNSFDSGSGSELEAGARWAGTKRVLSVGAYLAAASSGAALGLGPAGAARAGCAPCGGGSSSSSSTAQPSPAKATGAGAAMGVNEVADFPSFLASGGEWGQNRYRDVVDYYTKRGADNAKPKQAPAPAPVASTKGKSKNGGGGGKGKSALLAAAGGLATQQPGGSGGAEASAGRNGAGCFAEGTKVIYKDPRTGQQFKMRVAGAQTKKKGGVYRLESEDGTIRFRGVKGEDVSLPLLVRAREGAMARTGGLATTLLAACHRVAALLAALLRSAAAIASDGWARTSAALAAADFTLSDNLVKLNRLFTGAFSGVSLPRPSLAPVLALFGSVGAAVSAFAAGLTFPSFTVPDVNLSLKLPEGVILPSLPSRLPEFNFDFLKFDQWPALPEALVRALKANWIGRTDNAGVLLRLFAGAAVVLVGVRMLRRRRAAGGGGGGPREAEALSGYSGSGGSSAEDLQALEMQAAVRFGGNVPAPVAQVEAPELSKSKAVEARATVAKSSPAVVIGALASVGADVVKGVQKEVAKAQRQKKESRGGTVKITAENATGANLELLRANLKSFGRDLMSASKQFDRSVTLFPFFPPTFQHNHSIR